MFENIEFTEIGGNDTGKALKLFALTTCGFCKRAVSFLNENNVSYSMVYIDKLDPQDKQRVKDEFLAKFGQKMLFPTLVIDDSEFLPGFIRLHWEKLIS